MPRFTLAISLIATISLLIFGSLVSHCSVSLGQGKGGEVISKPTPSLKPSTKKPIETTRSSARAFQPQNPQIELVRIPPGSFMMGSNNSSSVQSPVHQVTIDYSFYIGKFEVTQAQWQSVMGNNPSRFRGCGRCPVEQISWADAKAFLRRLNQMNDGNTYRLPTEAEWEYACRAGTKTEFLFGDSPSEEQAKLFGNYNRQKTMPIGSFEPNAFGLFDMTGNVSEWCEDQWHDSYKGAPNDGGAWIDSGTSKVRVHRGGSWELTVFSMSSASRSANDTRAATIGFRVVAVR